MDKCCEGIDLCANPANSRPGTKPLNLASRNIIPSSIIPMGPNVGTGLIAALRLVRTPKAFSTIYKPLSLARPYVRH
jgi:hypothetical protein